MAEKQDVRLAILSIDAFTSIRRHEIPLIPGVKNVARIHAIQWGTWADAKASQYVRAWLSDKSGETPEPQDAGWPAQDGEWQQDPQVLDWFFARWIEDASSADTIDVCKMEYKVMPVPVLIVRQPSLLIIGDTTVNVQIGLWYTLEKPSDKRMKELMVKHHY